MVPEVALNSYLNLCKLIDIKSLENWTIVQTNLVKYFNQFLVFLYQTQKLSDLLEIKFSSLS